MTAKPILRQAGFTLLEVLVTIIVLVIGLLGLAGLQVKAQQAGMESYQRAQALILLNDMVDRINANRREDPDNYVTAIPRGGDNDIEDCTGLTGAALDLCDWNNALLGATESAGGQNVGAMIGARGCITNTVATMPREFVVAVVWQGLTPTVAPTSTDCGEGSYGNDDLRRAMIARVMIGCLQNDPLTGLCVTP
jgi:type IV pilus assembly protein PilV